MDVLTACFRSDDIMRSRNVSAVVHAAVLDLPAPTPALLADWQREISLQLRLGPGDIEPMPLARTRVRWSGLARCIDAAKQWMATLALPGVLDDAELALMASRGTRYHHDGAQYGGAVFCNLFLSEDSGTELHFPISGRRIALVRGAAVIFDPCQPHAIIKRGAAGFDEADFDAEQDLPQVFLTWELAVDNMAVTHALGIRLDAVPMGPLQCEQEQVFRNGAPVVLCARTGAWRD